MAKKKSPDLFGEENTQSGPNDFRSMMAESLAGSRKKIAPGDQFRGEIQAITKEEAIVSFGTGTDGILPVADLKDDKGQLKYNKGDVLDVVVVRASENEIRLKRKDSTRAVADLDGLEDAFDMELPVEGKVVESVKGGFRVKILGKMAFCPISQMDLSFVNDPAPYLGNNFEFIITRMDEGGSNVVISRRKVLELQRAEKEGEFLQNVKSDQVLQGVITRLEPFGAFVKVDGGVEGLVHISELAWGRVKHPSEVVSVGAPVSVKVLKVEEAGDRLKLSLSIKQGGGESDPWLTIEDQFPVGRQLEGIVEKKEAYGLFVQLKPGITGLLPKSKWTESLEGSKYDTKKKGDVIKVQIDQILKAERKISLGVPGDAVDESWREHAKGTKGLGTLGDILSKVQTQKKSTF